MAERIAKIVLLVEDVNQENLIRRYLQQLGHDNRSLRPVRLQGGRGSGERFVREGYASEVRAIRSQMARTKACLIAMIDADSGSVEDRRRQLQRALQDADEPPRTAKEPILNLIPKRNVETWILCLNSELVDELTDYRHNRGVDAPSIRKAATTLFSWTRPNAEVPESCVSSLREGLGELLRVPDRV
jgi:hypothetical protein